ncbi:MAG: hypothetical protein RMM98_15790 [Acidobacteriota bacterium]|nr:hypothetical protein [Blastocatellia bacterium]MDW8241066.1 hypothetical protein [Acidobacteriota bacterium]
MNERLGKVKFINHHLTGETMLMLVDGELSVKEAATARVHLEICWTCRRELEKIEETISLFVEFRKNIQIPLQTPPPKNWGGFRPKLLKIKESLKPRRRCFDLSDLSPFQLRMGIASIAAILILALFWQLISVRSVSAREILDRGAARQNEKLNAVNQPVVYQKLKVRVENSRTLDWEVWNDKENRRAKQVIGGSMPKESADILQELSEILQKNKMNPVSPLSPESFRAWHASLESKTDEIIEGDDLTLKTINHNLTFEGQISEAIIKFRKADFHPFEQILKVRTASGERQFEIAEVNFEIVGLQTLKPNFFEETPVSNAIVKVTKTEPSPEENETPESGGTSAASADTNAERPSPKNVESPKQIADANLEVEVLQILSNAKADLGEDISVKREGGALYVRGLVETAERKSEILNALQRVRQNPAVRIEIQTVAEAVAKNKNQTKPSTVDNLETKNLATAVENELVRKLGSEAEARRFATRTVNRSNQAMSHVYALRRLVRQFSPAEIKNLSPEARSKWLNLITSHARNFVAANAALYQDLDGVFDAPTVSGAGGVEINSADDLPRAIESLFAIASGSDRVIRSAMTISASDTQFSALRSAQFWQGLKNAEALANRIAALK